MKVRMMVLVMAVLCVAAVSFAGGPCCASKAEKAAEDSAEAVSADNEAAPVACEKAMSSKAACKKDAEGCPKRDTPHVCTEECRVACAAKKDSNCPMKMKAACASGAAEAAPAEEESAAPAE